MFLMILISTLLLQPAPLYVISPDFPNEGTIPVKFTCDGEDVSPTLIVNGIPAGTQSMALFVEDPEAAVANLTQWMVWNIPPVETIIEEGLSVDKELIVMKDSYRGPCPAMGETKRYTFKVYALDTILSLPAEANRNEVDQAIEGHILATGQLLGEYSRSVVTGKKRKK